MPNNIKLSPKHGVNPMVTQCFYCLEDFGVAMMGKLKDDAEAPSRGVVDFTPCPRCDDWMSKGVILVSVADSDEGQENPRRTGGFVVVNDDMIRQGIKPAELADEILTRRFAFVPDEAWSLIGLDRVPDGGQ